MATEPQISETGPERFIVGASEDTDAEYGSRSDLPFTVLSMIDGEIYSVEGFRTIEDAKADLKAGGVVASQIEYLG